MPRPNHASDALIAEEAARVDAEPDMLRPRDHNAAAGQRGRWRGIAAEQLRQIIARVEKLEEEKKAIADDIKEVYAEAKGNGFDTRTIRTIIRLRKKEEAEREEEEALLDLYKQALGMV